MYALTKKITGAEWKKTFFKWVKKLPFVKRLVEKELDKNMKSMAEDLTAQLKGMSYQRYLPAKGWSKDRVVKEIMKCNELGWFCTA